MGKSLLEVLRDAAVDPAEQAALEEIGATRYLARYGFDNVDPEDLREAVSLVADTLPPDVAQALPFSSESIRGGGMGPDTTLAFGAGSEPGAEAQSGAVHKAVVDAAQDMPNGPGGGQDTELDMGVEISSDITHTADAGVDVDASVDDADSFIDNFDESAGHTGLDDTAAPDDIGSF